MKIHIRHAILVRYAEYGFHFDRPLPVIQSTLHSDSYPFASLSVPTRGISTSLHNRTSAYIPYAYLKFCGNRSINEGTLHEEQFMFLPLPWLPAEKISWNLTSGLRPSLATQKVRFI